MNEPTVICLKGNIHTYGPSLKLAPDILYIGRAMNMGGWGLPKSKWENPFTVKQYGRDQALQMYQNHILQRPDLLVNLWELTGKRLGCWCVEGFPTIEMICHGQILVQLYRQFVSLISFYQAAEMLQKGQFTSFKDSDGKLIFGTPQKIYITTGKFNAMNNTILP